MEEDKDRSQPIRRSNVFDKVNLQSESFNYQLEFLKLEFNSINQSIERIDQITQTTKNWAVLTWAGSIALAIGQGDLRRYILLTAVLPMLFWLIDAHWRRIQRSFIYRVQMISDFLNDSRLVESFQQRKLIDFTVLDPRGRQYKNTQEYKSFTRVIGTMWFREVAIFYSGLATISVALWLFFVLLP